MRRGRMRLGWIRRRCVKWDWILGRCAKWRGFVGEMWEKMSLGDVWMIQSMHFAIVSAEGRSLRPSKEMPCAR